MICEKIFSVSSQLDIHLQTHAGEKTFKCIFCKKTFCISSELKIHKLEKNHSNVNYMKRNLCNLLRKRLHTGEKPFKCTFCKKAFHQSTQLTTQTHAGTKSYKCFFGNSFLVDLIAKK